MKIFCEGKEIESPELKDGFSLLKLLSPLNKNEIVGFLADSKLHGLREELEEGSTISFVRKNSKEGLELLRHSASHLMAQAIKHLYPDVLFGFGPAIEEGFYYDVDFKGKKISEEDFIKIEEEMKRIAKENLPILPEKVTSKEALKFFSDNPYKQELIKEHSSEGISFYTQGDFTDLCKGPHLASTGLIKHFKLLSLAGAYWRGNSENPQLTRIYATAFYTEEELQHHLKILEERKANDHRKLGKELGLFFISEYGPGFPFFLPRGMALKNALLAYWREIHTRYGYQEIETPTMLSKELWETSGHWDHYKENMYTTKIDEKEFAIKPMNCPGAILTYKQELHSYRDLPLRYAELGHVHRYEASGALNGLFRVRAFTQDDAHIFVREDQIESEVKNIMALFDEVYDKFGLQYHIVLSTRPEKDYIGTIEFWDKAEEALRKACEESGRTLTINPGDGAFYGPKLDFKLQDSMGRTWQCGTIQLDLNLPARFDCTYVASDGSNLRPIMLHRVVFGSLERFIGILTENFGGAFPLWLAPEQIRLLPVNNLAHAPYAEEIKKALDALDVRATIDESNEKLSYRMRSAIAMKIPLILVLGDHEKEEKKVTIRFLKGKEQITLSLDEFLDKLKIALKERTYSLS